MAELPRVEFRVILLAGIPVKQYRPVGGDESSWVDVTSERLKKTRVPKRCQDTYDMFADQQMKEAVEE